MYRALLADARFHELLLAFDRDLAAAARAAGCARCGGVLHSARFRRKPRGGPVGLGEVYDQRLSFCCAVDLCRKRTTPPSFRFLGRKVYLGAVVVLVCAMRQGAVAARQLSELFGVSRRLRGEPVLAGGGGRIHAARRSGSLAGLADRAFHRQRRGAAHCAAALVGPRIPRSPKNLPPLQVRVSFCIGRPMTQKAAEMRGLQAG